MSPKKWLIIGSIIIALIAFSGMVLAQEPITIVVNGQQITSDPPAQIIDGRTMLPLRAVADALGATVDWNANTRTVTIVTKAPTPQPVAFQLITLNGEATTWPYWVENGTLYMEYRDAVALLRIVNPNPLFVVNYYPSNNQMTVNNASYEVPFLKKGQYQVISLGFLKNKGLLNYEWDAATGNLKIIPVK